MTRGEYLTTAAAMPPAWGSHDCCTFPSGWVIARRGHDPMAVWRGRYSTAAGAARHIRRDGGLEAMWRVSCARIGMREIRRPRAGDVGLIDIAAGAGRTLLVGAICVGAGRWAALSEAGLFIAPARPRAAWRV